MKAKKGGKRRNIFLHKFFLIISLIIHENSEKNCFKEWRWVNGVK